MSTSVNTIPEGMSVVMDEIYDTGFRSVHFIVRNAAECQAGLDYWLARVPESAFAEVQRTHYEEIGMWHGHQIWPVKGELVQYKDHKGLLWKMSLVGKEPTTLGEKLSDVGSMLTWMHYALLDRFPERLWVGSSMKEHQGKRIDAGETGPRVAVEVAPWLNELCVMAG